MILKLLSNIKYLLWWLGIHFKINCYWFCYKYLKIVINKYIKIYVNEILRNSAIGIIVNYQTILINTTIKVIVLY